MDNDKKYKIYESGFNSVGEYKNEEEIRFYLKNVLSTNTNLNVLIGSGCSIPAIPTMNETFDNLKENNNSIKKLIEIYKGTELSINKDPYGNNIELFLSWLGNRIEGLSKKELVNNEVEIKKNDN